MNHRITQFACGVLATAAFAATAASAQPTPVLVVVDSLEADPASSEVTLIVRTTVAAAVGSGSLVLEAVEKGADRRSPFRRSSRRSVSRPTGTSSPRRTSTYPASGST